MPSERFVTKCVIGVCLAGVILLGISVLILWNRAVSEHNALQAEVATQNRALCLSKADRRHGLTAAVAFLHQHPNGTPDFSRAFILQTIAQDKTVLKNLADVVCTRDELTH